MNYTTAVKPSSSTDSSPPTSDSSRETSKVHDEDRFTLENEIDNAISHVNSSMIASPPQPPPSAPPPSTPPLMPPPNGSPPPPPPPSSSSFVNNPEDWNMDQVADWLKSVGLGNVSNIFIGKSYEQWYMIDVKTCIS